MIGETTSDGFLGQRLQIEQPRRGFRAGHDTVLLAAAVPARSNEFALELGSGVGVASLCLAARIPGLRVLGVELNPELAALANRNAATNNLGDRVRFIQGDALGAAVGGAIFAHVFFNPPFHHPSGEISPHADRDLAKRDTGNALKTWTERAISLLDASGTITLVTRADRFDEWRVGLSGMVEWIPILSRKGEAPKRIIARLHPGRGDGVKELPAVTLHESNGAPTDIAEAVLRRGDGLP